MVDTLRTTDPIIGQLAIDIFGIGSAHHDLLTFTRSRILI